MKIEPKHPIAITLMYYVGMMPLCIMFGVGLTGIFVLLPLNMIFGDMPNWLEYIMVLPLTLFFVGEGHYYVQREMKK